MNIEGECFLITGGYGLVASHVADQLLLSGAAEVRLLDNAAVGSAATIAHLADEPRVKMIRGDILRIEDLMAATDGVAGVFHAAMFITIPLAANLPLGMDVNVKGTVNLLEACRWRGVRKLVYSSSISAYGNQSSGTITEDSAYVVAGMHPASALYGLSKLMGEQLCAFHAAKYGLEWMSLRLSTVYGERQHARGINVLPLVASHDRIRRGLPPTIPGDGTEARDYIYVGDVARAEVLAMAKEVNGEVLTIASGRPSSFKHVVDLVSRACGSDLAPEYDMNEGRLKSAALSEHRFDISKAELLLGWRPETSLEEGIRRFVAWRDQTLTTSAML